MDDEAAAKGIVARLNRFRRRLYEYRQICAEANIAPRDDDEDRLLHEWTFINVPDPADDESAPMAMAPATTGRGRTCPSGTPCNGPFRCHQFGGCYMERKPAPSAPTTGGRGRG